MTRLARLRYLRIAGLAVGAVVVGGAAVLITASAAGLSIGFHPAGSSHPGSTDTTTSSLDQASTASSICTEFISHLSSDLGKSQTDVNSAIQKAINQTLADEVSHGTLKQAQAQKIQQRLANQQVCALAGGLGTKPSAETHIGAYKQQLLAAAAAALGISQAQLQTDLAGGMSLSQIAAVQKPPVTEEQFRSKLIAQLKPMLETAVTDGKLSSMQEQAILQRLQTGPIPFWNTPVRKPKAAASPSPSTT